ncbi:hypothetical protein [Paenibacillus plantiphilus]|uniref:hypothetical protein n=1 Tax=Paenibacillus plantiphilus TaxID=2905650 RepID=UPI001F331CAF|nr:hypothetical protein [Paenibacillus plantiphilus]
MDPAAVSNTSSIPRYCKNTANLMKKTNIKPFYCKNTVIKPQKRYILWISAIFAALLQLLRLNEAVFIASNVFLQLYAAGRKSSQQVLPRNTDLASQLPVSTAPDLAGICDYSRAR